ncbi:MAG: CsbD family protein [Planctomycetota bacterium]
MNWDRISGQWTELKGKARERWGKLTDDDTQQIEGKRERLAGALQRRYGWAKDKINEQIDAFLETLEPETSTR